MVPVPTPVPIDRFLKKGDAPAFAAAGANHRCVGMMQERVVYSLMLGEGADWSRSGTPEHNEEDCRCTFGSHISCFEPGSLIVPDGKIPEHDGDGEPSRCTRSSQATSRGFSLDVCDELHADATSR